MTDEIEQCIGRVSVINEAGHNVATLARAELAALKEENERLQGLVRRFLTAHDTDYVHDMEGLLKDAILLSVRNSQHK